MVFDLPCVVQRSRNKDWWLCFLLFCASHQCWELVLGTWARLKGLRPALELRYWNSWRVLAWVSFPHPRQPLLSVAKEATLLLVDCQAWEHLYLHPPPLAGTWRLQNPTPPHCPHSTAVGVQMEKWCSLFFSFLFIIFTYFKSVPGSFWLLWIRRWVWSAARAFSCAESAGSEAHGPLLAFGASDKSTIATASTICFSLACSPTHQHSSTGRPGDGSCWC